MHVQYSLVSLTLVCPYEQSCNRDVSITLRGFLCSFSVSPSPCPQPLAITDRLFMLEFNLFSGILTSGGKKEMEAGCC